MYNDESMDDNNLVDDNLKSHSQITTTSMIRCGFKQVFSTKIVIHNTLPNYLIQCHSSIHYCVDGIFGQVMMKLRIINRSTNTWTVSVPWNKWFLAKQRSSQRFSMRNQLFYRHRLLLSPFPMNLSKQK